MPARTRTRIGLRAAIDRLLTFYGRPPRPPAVDPFELVIWENCAYLVDDARRATAFKRLQRAVGLKPAAILATPLPALADIIKEGGMHAARRAEKLHTAADIALDIGTAELRRAIKRSPEEAKQLLRRFPGIGEPGADKILLLCRGALTSRRIRTHSECWCDSATERRAATIGGCIARRRTPWHLSFPPRSRGRSKRTRFCAAMARSCASVRCLAATHARSAPSVAGISHRRS